MDPDFKLIYCVDPTKIKVNIREKFAKLTLSSNKKKVEAVEEKQPPAGNLTEQKRVSRNLINELSAADGMVQNKNDNNAYINPILRSNSSTRSSDEDDETYHEPSSQEVFLDRLVDMDSMQILNISQNNLPSNTNDINYLTDRLTQQVSSLNLNCNRISISSTEDLYESPIQTMAKVEQVSICISSSNDGDDDDDEDSECAITISDSSENEDYNVITSEIPKTGETADNLLPNTLSNDKVDRIEAFLRDVSQTRKEMGSVGKNNLALSDTEPMPPDFSGSFDMKHHTMDDTEPMSHTHTSAFSFPSQASTNIDIGPNQRDSTSRCLLYDETVANTIASNLSVRHSSVHSLERTCINSDSTIADLHNSSVVPDESLTILETDSEADNCQESLRTSDTNTGSDAGSRQQSLQKSDTNTALSAETQTQTPDTQSDDSQMLTQINPNSINISAKINIKIHISHRISSDDGSKEESDDEEEPQPPTDAPTECSDSNPDASNPREEPQTSTHKNCQKNRAAVPMVDCANDDHELSTNDNGDHNSSSPCDNQDHATTTDNDAIEDPNFMEHAQKLLNQLYGNAWRTPEVIRTLNPKCSDKNRKKPGCSKDPTTDLASKDVPENPSVEDSVLDDFSIFRRNIATDLDSTRTASATPRGGQRNLQTKKHSNTDKKPISSHRKEQCNFKVPQTEVKKKTRGGGTSNERWRLLISDSEDDCGNASEDDEPDKSDEESSASNENSDKSWSNEERNISSSSSESDDKRATKRCPDRTQRRNVGKTKSKQKKLVYLDLSKAEVEVLKGTPLGNNDENLKSRLQGILSSCKAVEKPKLEATPTTTKTKRKLFTANFGDECDDLDSCCTPPGKEHQQILENQNIRINCQPMPTKFEPFNKLLEAVKSGTPIFKIQTPKTGSTTKSRSEQKENMTPITKQNKTPNDVQNPNTCTPKDKYGFLKSLDVCVGKSLCHPEALYYRDNYRQKKQELTKKLYDLYNEKLFGNKLDVSIVWNKKLLNTAGRCLNKKKMGNRLSNIELSEKVLTSADRLRCTLIHELCHAATWIFNGEGGHGATWKSWASKANAVFPEIPKIGVCHQYDIEYKYTYKCTLCGAKSHAHSKSKKVESIRCSYCHGAIEIFLNKKDKDGNIMATPVREPTGFAKFVRDKYKEYKRPDLKHTDVMKILSNEFAMLKVANGK